MGNIFSASEIVELGIQIEKNGMVFYNILAKQSQDDKAGDVFKYLAGEEEKHIAVFKAILDKVEKYEPPKIYADEYLAYMNALASEHIFTKAGQGELIAKKMKNDAEAIGAGIKFEEDSIVFYEGMKKVIPEYDHKIVEELIAQEKDHLKKLIDLKGQI
ncbi:MAG: ferritin family protein [Candidatus Omnitrophica bacterium]|nr:ferritin family protein [Candidatus Omnitrophota bacterium]